jgi:hypothetical protein
MIIIHDHHHHVDDEDLYHMIKMIYMSCIIKVDIHDRYDDDYHSIVQY